MVPNGSLHGFCMGILCICLLWTVKGENASIIVSSFVQAEDSFHSSTTITSSLTDIPQEIRTVQHASTLNPDVSASVFSDTDKTMSAKETQNISDSLNNYTSFVDNATYSSSLYHQHVSTTDLFSYTTPSVAIREEYTPATASQSLESYSEDFHTPLMSLFVARSESSFYSQTTLFQASSEVFSSTTDNNEFHTAEPTTVPPEYDHRKLLMLVLRAEDCSRLSKENFEKMLGKLLSKYGFGDAVPEVSNAKCYSHLNINLTIGGSTPTLRFLPNIDGKSNVTVDILNRTFRIVKLEKVDLKFEKTKPSNSSSTVIASIAQHESFAYVAVGVSFGLVLVICITVCFLKCCFVRKSQTRYISGIKGTHMRLRPDDYTLTPIPRPSPLYVDYYSVHPASDVFSTASAGSVASATPIVEQGIVQPFDTSIVPMEDSSITPQTKPPQGSSAPVGTSDLKTFNVQRFGEDKKTPCTDSKENTKGIKKEVKEGGLSNPSFQRY